MRIDPLAAEILAGIADVLGETSEGLTNKEIREVLASADIEDLTPKPPSQYHYVAISKRDRIYNALVGRQQRDRAGNAAIDFVECAMAPGRYLKARAVFADRMEALNEVLSFAACSSTKRARSCLEEPAREPSIRRVPGLSACAGC